MQNSKILEISPKEATHIKMLNGSFYAGNNKLRPDGTVLRSSAVTTVHTLRSLDDIRTIVALEKKAQAGQENVKYWVTQFNELRSQFDEMQKRAEAAEAQASRVQELEQQKDTLELLVERIYEDADEFIEFLQGMGGRNHMHMAKDLEDWTSDVEKLMKWGDDNA